MSASNARHAGTFAISGEIEVARLAFGALRITGEGSWGAPDEEEEALRVLCHLPERWMVFIDTADTQGPEFRSDSVRKRYARMKASDCFDQRGGTQVD
ncbi:hypothetical protein [Paraburkholderia sacchari]|uniref:hypothetical protein n=1 Tax=Paraburkholderia sacchari TaxID=159450 RepID=UPI0039A62A1A